MENLHVPNRLSLQEPAPTLGQEPGEGCQQTLLQPRVPAALAKSISLEGEEEAPIFGTSATAEGEVVTAQAQSLGFVGTKGKRCARSPEHGVTLVQAGGSLPASSSHGQARDSRTGGNEPYQPGAEAWKLHLIRNCHILKPALILAQGKSCPIK